MIKKALEHKILIPGKFEQAPKLFCLKAFDRQDFLDVLSPQNFSPRELDCMRLLTRGYTQKMIAKALNISPRTVETHLNHIKDKTQTYSKGDLVKYLLKLPL